MWTVATGQGYRPRYAWPGQASARPHELSHACRTKSSRSCISLPAAVTSGTSRSICLRAHSIWFAFASGVSRLILKKLRQGKAGQWRLSAGSQSRAPMLPARERTSAARYCRSLHSCRPRDSCHRQSRWSPSQAKRGCAQPPRVASWKSRRAVLTRRPHRRGRRRGKRATPSPGRNLAAGGKNGPVSYCRQNPAQHESVAGHRKIGRGSCRSAGADGVGTPVHSSGTRFTLANIK